MTLSYWIADSDDDSPAYSIRAKTLREVKIRLTEMGSTLGTRGDPPEPIYRTSYGGRFRPPRRVTVEYADGFDLLKQCLDEGGVE